MKGCPKNPSIYNNDGRPYFVTGFAKKFLRIKSFVVFAQNRVLKTKDYSENHQYIKAI